MKLIIQMPCYNEEETLEVALKALPRKVEGFTKVEWLIIDDGSTDNSVKVAKKCGVDHIVSIKRNSGLAKVFMAGIDACLKFKADVIINTDADNQYDAKYIPALTKPILEKKADIVIGARPIANIKHFSFIKKLLQKFGSYVVRKVSKTDIPDAPSGFRAISREAAMQLNVFNNYTYTLETIIQAGRKNMAITWIPVEVNDDLRPSKLVKSIMSYVKKSLITIMRIFVVYEPFKFFITIGIMIFLVGTGIGIKFLVHYFMGNGDGHIQSLILASILLVIGFQTMITAIIVDLIAVNRKMMEDMQYRIRKVDAKN